MKFRTALLAATVSLGLTGAANATARGLVIEHVDRDTGAAVVHERREVVTTTTAARSAVRATTARRTVAKPVAKKPVVQRAKAPAKRTTAKRTVARNTTTTTRREVTERTYVIQPETVTSSYERVGGYDRGYAYAPPSFDSYPGSLVPPPRVYVAPPVVRYYAPPRPAYRYNYDRRDYRWHDGYRRDGRWDDQRGRGHDHGRHNGWGR